MREKYENKVQEVKNYEMQDKPISERYTMYGYKFENDKIFDETLKKLLEKYEGKENKWNLIDRDLSEATKSCTQKTMMERLNSGKFAYSPLGELEFDDIDLSKYPEALKHISFNEKTFSKVSKEHLPENFDPKKVLENGKSIGLGIDDVHEMGYTGKGVSYAIIDFGVAPHNDLHFKEYRTSPFAKENPENSHGGAVSYIAQQIAPEANCYYYAHNGKDMDAAVLDNLKAILEKNKTLKNNEKIRFVSMSMPLFGGEEALKVVKELEKQGVWVYYSGCPEDKNRGYLSKKNPMGDNNDFNNYEIGCPWNATLFVNSGNRTVPDPSSPNAYRHDSQASQSWSIPVIAGYYTLACQADPSMTKEKFLKLAEETAQKKFSTKLILKKDENGREIESRSEEKVEIKIIDIKALIGKIRQKKK